jgi:hypothetical protein
MNILISNNGRYFANGNTIYDVVLDESFDKDSLPLEFWINFLRENTIASYQHGIKSILELQKFLRECVYNFSTLIEGVESTKFILEYEKKFSNKLLNEDIEDYSQVLIESWDYIGLHLFEQETTWDKIKGGIKDLGSTVASKGKEIGSKVAKSVSSAWNFIKEKGAPWFFENLRKALFSWGGVAIQAFLGSAGVQAATGGITTALIVTVWGAMLSYDVFEALNGRTDWLNIIIDIISLVFAISGAPQGGKAVQAAASSIPKSQTSSLSKVLSYLSKSSVGKTVANIFRNLGSSLSSVLSTISKGIAWVGEKLGLTFLKSAASSIESFVKKTFSQLTTAASKTGNAVKTATKTNTGQTLAKGTKAAAVGGGLTYGIEKAVGGEGKTFAGAYQNGNSKEEELIMALKSNTEVPVAGEDYPEF